MLGISVVTPQCLTVGKAGLATNNTPLTAALAFRCSHPVELQQQQQKSPRAKDSTFKFYSASKKLAQLYLQIRTNLFRSENCEHTVEALTLPVTVKMAGKTSAIEKWEGLAGEMYCLDTPERQQQMGTCSCCWANRTLEQADCTFTFTAQNWRHYELPIESTTDAADSCQCMHE